MSREIEDRIAAIAERSKGIDKLRHRQEDSRQKLHRVLDFIEVLILKMKMDDHIEPSSWESIDKLIEDAPEFVESDIPDPKPLF